MYLLDTNIWLESLLNQEKSKEVRQFLDRTPPTNLYLTDFTLHSIGIILSKLKEQKTLVRFVQDVFTNGGANLIHLRPEDVIRLIDLARQFKLDFDDAYQYTAAEKYNLTIVSFDSDFDPTERGRTTPGQLHKN